MARTWFAEPSDTTVARTAAGESGGETSPSDHGAASSSGDGEDDALRDEEAIRRCGAPCERALSRARTHGTGTGVALGIGIPLTVLTIVVVAAAVALRGASFGGIGGGGGSFIPTAGL